MPDLPSPRTPAAIIEPIAAATPAEYGTQLRVVDGPEPGWTSLTAMACPIRTAARHRRIASAVGPGAPARLPVAWEIEAIGWFVGVLVGGCLIQGIGLVTPHPELTWARIGRSGLAEGLAVASETPCVPARTSAARGVPVGLLGPLIESADRRSARLLWWHAGDRLADALIWCGEAFGASDDARRIAEDMLAPGVPYLVPLGTVSPGAGRMRRTCCLSRRTADGETCDGCPHRRKLR